MPRIDLAFLLLAALCLVGGVWLGMSMGVRHDFSLSPVHAHLNLVGWASLAIYGLSYRAFPELGGGWLARLHFAASAPSGVLFPLAILWSMHGNPGATLILAPMWFLGALLFAANVARAMLRWRPTRALDATVTAEAQAVPAARS